LISDTQKYSSTLRWTHWLTAFAILAAYVAVNITDSKDPSATGFSTTMQLHFLAGLVVLVLLVPRIISRRQTSAPPILPSLSPLTRLAARTVHVALYAFLLVQPILGVLQVNYLGLRVPVPYTSYSLPALVGANAGAHHFVAELHETVGEIFYWVIGLHVAMALWHHFKLRDTTLRRML
jgi:cytochrome b561